MSAISIQSLEKRHGENHVLKSVDLSIEAGEFIVLLGPSGCGKSTLLNAIAGLDPVDGGKILIAGTDVTDLDPSRRGISMVFQSYALYPTMSVRKNLSFGLRVSGVANAEIVERVERVSRMLQIEPFLDRKPAALSGGQRQRVAIGRALVKQSKVFLFDEPLSNLDAKLRTETRIELKKLHRDLGATMLYVTHDQIEAMTLATRVAVMKSGRVEQYAAPEELYERPATLFVAGFVGSPSMNFLKGKLGQGGILDMGTFTIDTGPYVFEQSPLQDQSVVLGVRPEHISLAERPDANVVQARLLFTEPMGADTLGWFDLAGQRIAVRLDPPIARSLPDDVFLRFDMKRASIFDEQTEQRL